MSSSNRVVLVGHCMPDTYMLKSYVGRILEGSQVEAVNTQEQAAELAGPGTLMLINRVLDGRFSTGSGIELIPQFKQKGAAVMLISNFPEAQQEAEQAGALPGFGKSELGREATEQRLRDALVAEQGVNMLGQVDHINIVVLDMQTMLRFYRDTLGFEVTKDVTIEGDWIDRVVGMTGVRAHVVYLSLPSGPRIELIDYLSPPGVQQTRGGEGNTSGIRHMAFQVDNLDSAYEKLNAAGVTFVGPPQQVPDAQVTYAGGIRKRLAYFHDPEGNLLELCEYR